MISFSSSLLTLDLKQLLEEVSGKKLEFYVKKPDNMTKKIDNLNLFIKFLSHLGLKVTGVSAMGKWREVWPDILHLIDYGRYLFVQREYYDGYSIADHQERS